MAGEVVEDESEFDERSVEGEFLDLFLARFPYNPIHLSCIQFFV